MRNEDQRLLEGHEQTHRDLTALGISVGRFDERLIAMQAALDRHMREEHAEFTLALQKVEELGDTVRDLHSAAKVTRWIAAVASGIGAFLFWVKDHIRLV